MKRLPLGDDAVVVTDLPIAPWRFAAAARDLGVQDAVASYTTVGLYGDHPDLNEILEHARSVAVLPREHLIPVRYDGEDLTEAAACLGLAPDDLIRLHSSAEYECAAVGFLAGFAYLGPLPEALRGVPRRSTPRPAVPAQSVAITGNQTAVYPIASPGGWALIGTAVADVSTLNIQPGDRVKFHAEGAIGA